MKECILSVENLSFGYSKEREIISDISFDVVEPEFICIVGPNGVGKSTLVKCINGSLKPTSGSVYLDGIEISNYSLKEKARKISYVPVATDDHSFMSVIDTVLTGRYSHQSWRTSSKDILKSYKALEALQCEDLALCKFNELSAGQHQRVALARGLVQEAKIMILDEPTSNLDPRHQIYVSSFLSTLSKKLGITIIMISHDLNISSRYADRLIVLEPPGKVYGIGKPKEIITEEMIRKVYGVESEIVDDRGRPHVMLQDVIFQRAL